MFSVPASNRAQLDLFEVTTAHAPPRDQQDLMQHPFFSLSKTKRRQPILYKAGDTEVRVHGFPDHGMATIWDADILIWAASQLVRAADLGAPTSRFFRFTPRQFLTSVGRGVGQRQYLLLKAALQRLQSTVVVTTIRQGPQWRRQQFSWINEWTERLDHRGRGAGIEFVLPEWFYSGVLDRSLVLSIDPAYFQLTGGIERWLYRVARKHAGRQPEGWSFELRHLHAKSGSQARFSDFALDLRRIAGRQSLPGYRLALAWQDGRDLLDILPAAPGDGPVDNPRRPRRAHGTSGAAGHGTSGAPLFTEIDSNSDSNSVAGARRGERP